MKKREIMWDGEEEKDAKGYDALDLQALYLWPPACWLGDHSQTELLDPGLMLTWICSKQEAKVFWRMHEGMLEL